MTLPIISKEMAYHAISSFLSNQQGEITFSRLSEELKIPVHVAKQYLTSYVHDTVPTPRCSFLLELERRSSPHDVKCPDGNQPPAVEFRPVTSLEELKATLHDISAQGKQHVASICVSSIWNVAPLDRCALWRSELAIGAPEESEAADPSHIPFYVVHQLSHTRKPLLREFSVPTRPPTDNTATSVSRNASARESSVAASPVVESSLVKHQSSSPATLSFFTSGKGAEVKRPPNSTALSAQSGVSESAASSSVAKRSAAKEKPVMKCPPTGQQDTTHTPIASCSSSSGPSATKIKQTSSDNTRIAEQKDAAGSSRKDQPGPVPSVRSPLLSASPPGAPPVAHTGDAPETEQKHTLWDDEESDAACHDTVMVPETAAACHDTVMAPGTAAASTMSTPPQTYVTRIKVEVEKKSKVGKYMVVDAVSEMKEVVSLRTSKKSLPSNTSLSSLEPAPKKQQKLFAFFQKTT